MDIFIYILAGLAFLLIVFGLRIILDDDLEIGRLLGFQPVAWGIGIGALAGLLWCIQHLSIRTV